MAFSLQQLRYLTAVADTLHFRRAADRCHVSQPTLSAQLAKLEAQLDTKLVERSRARVVLTPEGAEIAARARTVLREVDEITALAARSGDRFSGTIRVGVVQSLGSYLLPLVIPDLHAAHPQLKLYVREGLANELIEKLDDGALDLLFFPLPARRGDFEDARLFREPLQVVTSTDHALSELPRIPREKLAGETLLTLEPGHRLHEQVRQVCEATGANLSLEYGATSLDTIRQMVAMGMGLSLMPALYVASEVAHQDIVVARRFRGAAPSRTVGMIWRRGTARQPEYRELARLIGTILRSRAPGVMVLG